MSGGHAAVHVAMEQRRRRLQEEEEKMTPYTPSELNEQWEFKIVRSVTEAFKKPEIFKSIVEEESLAGWDLLEKLDDGRLRFKRPTSARRKDPMLPPGIDPYRTRYGMTEGGLAFRIMMVVVLVMGLVLTLVALGDAGYLF